MTAHLPAHQTEKGLAARNHTYHLIDRNLRLRCELPAGGGGGGGAVKEQVRLLAPGEAEQEEQTGEATPPRGPGGGGVGPAGGFLSERFESVIWLGDMNYRINGNRAVRGRGGGAVTDDAWPLACGCGSPPSAYFSAFEAVLPTTGSHTICSPTTCRRRWTSCWPSTT